MTESPDMSKKEILYYFKENYGKILKLLEDSKNAEFEPDGYLLIPIYIKKAKERLVSMSDSLKKLLGSRTNFDEIKLHAMLGTVLLNMGIIDMKTKERTSEKVLSEAVTLLAPNSSKPEIIITLINVYNNLGILWSYREKPNKAKTYLLSAKELYENFKCTMQLPLPIEQIVSPTGESPLGDIMLLEKAHTLTLHNLAEVYGSLNENLKSAIYCHVTLRRQLQYNDYEPIDWALSSATLSQFFAEQNGFFQSRHHLAAASTILEQYEEKLGSEENDEIETFKHRSADVAHHWAKYCILLMSASKARLMTASEQLTEAITDMSNIILDDHENICGCDITELIFTDIDVSKYQNKIGDKFLLTCQDAREVFLYCQTWLNKAKEYYKEEAKLSSCFASDIYIELILDTSKSYSYLAFFEDDERRAQMHKRRIDMLEDLLKEINPTTYCRTGRLLWFELGEVYSDILNIELEKLNRRLLRSTTEKPTQLIINNLCEKSIENFDHFLNSCKIKNGWIPLNLYYFLIKPIISAYAFIGRNSMKKVAVDKVSQLRNVQKSFDSYQAVVDICTNYEEAAVMMHEEFALCQEMVKILPEKIKRLQMETQRRLKRPTTTKQAAQNVSKQTNAQPTESNKGTSPRRPRGPRGRRNKAVAPPAPAKEQLVAGSSGEQATSKRARLDDTQSPRGDAKRAKADGHSKRKVSYADASKSHLQVAIVTVPPRDLTQAQTEQLRAAIDESVLQTVLAGKTAPSFRGRPFHLNGVLAMWCEDAFALSWLEKAVKTIASSLPDTTLAVIRQADIKKRQSAELLLHTSITDAATLHNAIRAQNPWYKVDTWQCYDMTVDDLPKDPGSKEKVVHLILGIPEDQKQGILDRERRVSHMSGSGYLRFFSNEKAEDQPTTEQPAEHKDTSTSTPPSPRTSLASRRVDP